MADDFQEDIRISELPETGTVSGNNDYLAVIKPSPLYTSGYKTFKVKAANLPGGGGGASSADDVTYDNSTSGLSADNVQSAIDELAQGSGGSTVEVTQVQTTGTKIATITVDSVGTDLYAPNGGAGGHTIVDEEGASLTQRTNLQFNGVYLEDNSTDDTTEVNVVRSMKYADFQQLSADEQKGFIDVTDVTGGGEDKFQPVIYSEDEREVGVWLNGKPLYEKTIFVDSFPNNTSKSLTTPTSLELLIDSFGFMKSKTSTGYCRTLPFAAGGTNDVRVDTNDGTLRVVTFSDWSSYEGYITIRYTKSTDQAGSGTWTPQGVPAVHYSTDEQVVGTWIDGNTIYEKTIVLSASISIAGNTWTDVDNSDWSIVDTFVGGFMINANGAFVGFVAFDKNTNNNKLRVLQTRNADITCKTIVVRYTKSSS